jgi:large subunit ribosomal protein L4
MMEAKVLNLKGAEVGSLKLPEKVFGVKPQPTLLHEVATAYLSNQREGSAHTKTRAEVSGGGKKPWKQKGTGRARHGSSRSPIWRHGGVAWGPRNTVNYRQELPRAKWRLGLAHALSARAADGGLKVLESLALDGAKTKQVAALLKAVKAGKRALIVTEAHDANLVRASKNVEGLKVSLAAHLNAYDVLACRTLIMTKGAIEKLAPRWN